MDVVVFDIDVLGLGFKDSCIDELQCPPIVASHTDRCSIGLAHVIAHSSEPYGLPSGVGGSDIFDFES